MIFEPLGDHDRSVFVCGTPELDRYFQTQASQDARRKVATPFVMVDETRRVLGYYTLSAYGVRAGELSPEVIRKLPRYPLLPATLLGRLAVHQDFRGKGLGSLILMDALRRSWKNTTEVASVGVVAEAIDENAHQFYLHHQFLSFDQHPDRLFIAMGTLAKLFR